MQPTKATIAELCAARAGRKWNFERFKGHEPREDVPMQLASRSHAKPCPWRGERAAQKLFKKNESAHGFATVRLTVQAQIQLIRPTAL